jgi:hypothetical protein
LVWAWIGLNQERDICEAWKARFKEGRRSTIMRAVGGGRGQEEEGMRAAHLSNKTASLVDTDQTRDGNYPYDSASSRGATSQQHDKPNILRR